MHGSVAWQALEFPGHVDQEFYLLVAVVCPLKIRVHFQRAVYSNIQFLRDHLRDSVAGRVRQIERPSDVTDRVACSHRSESNDLHHALLTIFAHDIVDHFLTTLVAEIDVDIRHRDTLWVQETLEEQLVADRVNVRDLERIGHDTARCAASAGSERDAMALRIIDEVPNDQEVIHETHGRNNAKLIFHTLPMRFGLVFISLLQSLIAQHVQIIIGCIALRDIVFRQFRHAELDLDVAPLGDLLRILQRLRHVRKQFAHLLFRFQVELTALVTHPVGVRDLLTGLDAEQDVVRLRIVRVNVMHVVRAHQVDPEFLMQAHELLVHQTLLRDAVVLKF